MADDDPLAYGDYHGDRGNAEGEATGERGFFGDTLTKLKKNDGISNIFNKGKLYFNPNHHQLLRLSSAWWIAWALYQH